MTMKQPQTKYENHEKQLPVCEEGIGKEVLM